MTNLKRRQLWKSTHDIYGNDLAAQAQIQVMADRRALELKQKNAAMRKNGHEVYVVRSFPDFMLIVKNMVLSKV